uniref:Cytochrome P450 like protein n=2 Tax=Coptotermes formosanus TaxID=36987 RepID=R4V1S5_COPFO|nr:cytochrome P450 like protein [Coptotermes formosanus]
MQTKVGLICLLSRYKFQTCEKTSDPLKIDPKKFIMTPIEGVWLKATYRDRLDS